jgi:adenylate cyclase
VVRVEAAAVLEAYWRTAATLVTRRFGGVVEKFICDGVVAAFNRGGNQPDHARRAACAALALQDAFGKVSEQHADWPRMRVGVNSGEAVVREIGGAGHLSYPLVGDTINMGSRLEGLAPVGGVLIGAETFEQLPDGAVVEVRLQVKGKDEAVDAYVLNACPC